MKGDELEEENKESYRRRGKQKHQRKVMKLKGIESYYGRREEDKGNEKGRTGRVEYERVP